MMLFVLLLFLLVAGCLLFLACCDSFVACCLLFVVFRLLAVACLLCAWCLLLSLRVCFVVHVADGVHLLLDVVVCCWLVHVAGCHSHLQ